jgi:hypothetical protein
MAPTLKIDNDFKHNKKEAVMTDDIQPGSCLQKGASIMSGYSLYGGVELKGGCISHKKTHYFMQSILMDNLDVTAAVNSEKKSEYLLDDGVVDTDLVEQLEELKKDYAVP